MTTPSNASMTPAQEEVLNYIRQCCEKEGVPPSYRQIQEHLNYKAVGTVQDHVKALIKKGFLEKPDKERKARGLIPTGHKWEGVKRLPIYGEIAAGGPRDSAQLEMGGVLVAESEAKGECFALRVVGDSMIDAGILEGDIVIVQRGVSVRHGDIIVALLNGETTVKRYHKKDGKILLMPENKRLSPIPVVGRLEIQGKVVSLQRKL